VTLACSVQESKRYYMAGTQRLHGDDECDDHGGRTELSSTVHTEAARDEEMSTQPMDTSDCEPCCVQPSRINTLLSMARSGPQRLRSEATELTELEPLPEGETFGEYTIDRDAETDAAPGRDMHCPENLEDMLVIVRELRRARLNQLIPTVIAASHNANEPRCVSQETGVVVVKGRVNNFKYGNISDFVAK
jgi:hypothetical protein